MALQRTFVMLKPDALRRRLVGEILTRLERTGLELVAARLVQPNRELAGRHYGQAIIRRHGERVRQLLIDYITSGPCLAMVWEGRNAVRTMRQIAGEHFCPQDCPPGTIRRDMCSDSVELADAEGRALENLIHTADSLQSAAEEIRLWFPEL